MYSKAHHGRKLGGGGGDTTVGDCAGQWNKVWERLTLTLPGS